MVLGRRGVETDGGFRRCENWPSSTAVEYALLRWFVQEVVMMTWLLSDGLEHGNTLSAGTELDNAGQAEYAISRYTMSSNYRV